ncbi:Uncharacterised protein [Vibrio cholerae]|nr:Uncharacterised protein [Vibrio cholerae]
MPQEAKAYGQALYRSLAEVEGGSFYFSGLSVMVCKY